QEPDGEIVTAGPHNVVSPPTRIAQLALQHGHAVPPDSETARALRALADPHPGWFSPQSCLDISQPIPAPKPPELHEPARHLGPPAEPYAGVVVAARAVPVR